MTAPELRFAFELEGQVGRPVDIGLTGAGRRRMIPIQGGRFHGPKLSGRILEGGADWQIVYADGSAELDARYVLETESGALIYVMNRGMRRGPPEILERLNRGENVDPEAYYFRTSPSFETAAPEFQWLARSVFVGVGERYPDKVVVRFWQVM
jgi:hypothetical protein